jgi:predicted glycosyltransferase
MDPESLRALRSRLLLDIACEFRPDLVLVDKSPAGLMGELAPTVRMLHDAANPAQLVLGWRDILDHPARIRDEWEALGTLAFIEKHYQEVWVYGDPEVFDVRREYPLPERLAARVRYLGYLVPQADHAATLRARERFAGDGAPLAVVTAGGGEDGEPLLACYLEALHQGLLPDGLRSLVVTGPCMPDDAQQRLRARATPRAQVVPFIRDFEATLAAADVVVSMAGYNTVCELLGAGTPAVLAPRVGHRLEQQLRAERLAARGLVERVDPTRLVPASLAAALRRALQRGRRAGGSVRADGLLQAPREVRRLLPPAPAVPTVNPSASSGTRRVMGATGAPA